MNISTNPEGDILTDRDLAKILNVTYRTIQLMARKGDIRGKQVGRAWRFHREALKDFLLKK